MIRGDLPPTIDGAAFREAGYLQEANRQFFHPLGLAMGVDETGAMFVFDMRDDPEGVVFCELDDDTAKANAYRVLAESIRKAEVRQARFGWSLQPIESVSADCPE